MLLGNTVKACVSSFLLAVKRDLHTAFQKNVLKCRSEVNRITHESKCLKIWLPKCINRLSASSGRARHYHNVEVDVGRKARNQLILPFAS